jgi:ABC-type bacteriocin/lantibiotic exporter with double-glycine peptidase domain
LNILLFYLVLAWGAGASHVIDHVPFVGQETQHCGPASLSSVLSYYGDAVEQKKIGEAVLSTELQGALITDLENYGRKRGFQTKIGRGRTADIRKFLSENRPVIVLVDLGFWVISRPHYLVVFGYNDRGFLAHDGFEAAHLYPYKEFEKIWEKAGSSFLLLYR